MTASYQPLGAELQALSARPDELCARLERHAELLRFNDFGPNDAWVLGSLVREEAAAHSLPITVSIVMGQQRVFHAALPGASANNDRWAARKIAVAQLFGQASLLVGAEAKARGSDINDRLPAADFASHGGAVPILTRAGALLGVIAISGLVSEDDHAFAVTALAVHLGISPDSL